MNRAAIAKSRNSRIAASLADAEQALKTVISEAGQLGLYAVASNASQIAGEISKLLGSVLEVPSGGADTHARGSGTLKRPAPPVYSNAIPVPQRVSAAPSNHLSAGFQIVNDTLVRAGKSATGGLYEHKVPHAVFNSIVDAMATVAQVRSDPVSIDDIIAGLPAGADVPRKYQFYAVVGFLRAKRSLIQDGRNGYLLTPSIAETARKVWIEAAAGSSTSDSSPQNQRMASK
jgi:hypothetical protein